MECEKLVKEIRPPCQSPPATRLNEEYGVRGVLRYVSQHALKRNCIFGFPF